MRAQVIIKQLNFVRACAAVATLPSPALTSFSTDWELCKLLRWSTPRRVSEAIPSLEWLMNVRRRGVSRLV